MASRLQIDLGQQSWTTRVDGNRVRLGPGEKDFNVTVTPGLKTRGSIGAGDRLSVSTGSATHTGNAVVSGDDVWVTIEGEVFVFTAGPAGRRARAAASRDQDAFTPPMSATVVRIAVAPGDEVEDGDVLIALEAMKMELPIRAPRRGVVRAVLCREGELVQPGQVLIEFE